MELPTAKGGANLLNTICEAREGLLAATVKKLLACDAVMELDRGMN